MVSRTDAALLIILFLTTTFLIVAVFDITNLYELLYILIAGIVIVTVKLLYDRYREMRPRNDNMSFSDFVSLIFNLAIVFFAITQAWIAIYLELPRIFHPTITCVNNLEINDGLGNITISVGNYGNLPAYVYSEFVPLTDSIKLLEEPQLTLQVLIPIKYNNNEQLKYRYNFKVDTESEFIAYKIKYYDYSDDFIGRVSVLLKKRIGLVPIETDPCYYSKYDENTYIKVPDVMN